MNELKPCIEDLKIILKKFGMNYEVRIIANKEFSDRVLEPVGIAVSSIKEKDKI